MERDGVLPSRRSTRVLRPVPRPNRRWVPDRQVRPLRTPVPKKVSSGTPATTSALRPVRSTLSVPRRASRWPCSASAPRKTAPQVLGSAASAPFVVNNARLLPWVRIKHLPCPRTGDVCSTTAVTLCVQHCLRPFAKASRELATVQPTRVGKTQGRGKLDVKNEYALPVKDAKPLRRDEGSQSQIITRVANAYHRNCGRRCAKSAARNRHGGPSPKGGAMIRRTPAAVPRPSPPALPAAAGLLSVEREETPSSTPKEFRTKKSR